MRFIFYILLLSLSAQLQAQPLKYTSSNVHSHNDYEQKLPFWNAYNHGFGSIEADVFLLPGEPQLLVAHTLSGLKNLRRTLDSLYLQPLVSCLQKNKDVPYSDTAKKLLLLVDVKTEAIPTLQLLIETLQYYPSLTNSKQLQFAISGNRPNADSFYSSPSFVQFDGELDKNYNADALEKIVLLSDNFKKYSNWNGKGSLPDADKQKLKKAIDKAHNLKKPVRFWNAPDDVNAWRVLMSLGVDYINTDHIERLSKFLEFPKNNG